MQVIEGWGVQPWGNSPWGGSVVEEIIGDFGDRYERVTREYRWKHEPPEILNVIFKVEGVTAKMQVGRPQVIAGHGIKARPRRSCQAQCGVGAVEIEVGTGAWVLPEAIASACECGGAEAGISVGHEISEGVAAECGVGLPSVRAIRNPTDEEFLMMLAEMP